MPYKDPIKRLEASRKHYAKRTPEQITQERERHQNYYQEQKERIAQVHAAYRVKAKETRTEYQRQYYQKNRGRIREYAYRWRDKNPTYQQHYKWFREHGISRQQCAEIVAAQNGLCAICHQPETKISTRTKRAFGLALDHNHKTKQLRGLLCNGCNSGLGYFKENPDLLIAAAEYLKKHSL